MNIMEIKEENLDNKPYSYGTTSYTLQKMDSNENLDELNIKQESIESISNIDIYEEMDIKEDVKWNNESYESDAADKSNINITVRTDKKEKSYSCFICGYRATLKHTLTTHIWTHTGERPYSCSICDYKARQKNHLTSHMRSHTGEKPYSCSVCEYKTIKKNNLIKHIRSHTGEKPFSCSVCSYKATQKNNLIRHLVSHIGEKTFSCSLCSYKATCKSILLAHMTGDCNSDCKAKQKQDLVMQMRKKLSTVLCVNTEQDKNIL